MQNGIINLSLYFDGYTFASCLPAQLIIILMREFLMQNVNPGWQLIGVFKDNHDTQLHD